MLRHGRTLAVERLESRWLLAGDILQIRHFETWDGGVIPSTDVAGLTYHAPSGNLFLADSEINELPDVFDGNNLFEVSLAGDTLFQEYVSNNNEPTGITYSEFDGYFYITNDTSAMRGFARYDSDLNNPLVVIDTRDDVPSSRDPEGITSDPFGNLYVADGNGGGLQVLTYDANLVFQGSFGVGPRMNDAEGIAYHPPTGHLFLVDGSQDTLFEYTTGGQFIEQYDINGFVPSPKSPQGLAFAPTSNPNDSADALALYIADGMRDNHPDGRVYEALILTAGNSPPVVNAGVDQTILNPLPKFAQLDGTVTDDDPPSVTTLWSQLSGPGTVTFGDVHQVDTTASFPALGIYSLRLTADDGQTSVSDDIVVTVTDEQIITVERRVAASEDDAEEQAGGSVKLTSSDLELVLDGSNQTVGVRFNQVAIPYAATIVNAYIQYQADETSSVATSLTIQGEDTDHALPFANASGNITSRERTASAVPWSPAPWTQRGEAGLDQQTPDITSVVQEIVNRPGWSSGNALAVIVSGSGKRTAESFNGDSSGAPLLHVEYTTGDPPANRAPLLAAIGNQSVMVGQTLDFTAQATDPDLPPDTLSFSLDAGAPPTATIDPIGGQFSWTPAESDLPGDYTVTVRVTDDGEPSLSDSESIVITLSEPGSQFIVETRVNASSDDAEERAGGNVKLGSSDLELVFDKSDQTVGIRFNDLAIPPSATIVRAYVQFQADETHSVSTLLNVQGEDTDHALTFSSSSGNISSRARTAAAVSWEPAAWTQAGEAGPDQQTPDIASVVQEIVNRPAWSSGNSLAIIITGSGERAAEAYDGDASGAALLHVEYTVGATPTAEAAMAAQPPSDALGNEPVGADDSTAMAGGPPPMNGTAEVSLGTAWRRQRAVHTEAFGNLYSDDPLPIDPLPDGEVDVDAVDAFFHSSS